MRHPAVASAVIQSVEALDARLINFLNPTILPKHPTIYTVINWMYKNLALLRLRWLLAFYLFLPQSLIRFGEFVLINSLYVRATVQLLLCYLATLKLPTECKAITVQLLPRLFRL